MKKSSEIQALRGLAIAEVLLQHLCLVNNLPAHLPSKTSSPFYIGVELFLAISGYVVTNSIFSKSTSALSFIIRRFFRLLPAMMVKLAFTFACIQLVAVFAGESTWAQNGLLVSPRSFVEQSLGLISGFLINQIGRPTFSFGAMWSLSVEFQFYYAYAVLLLISGVLLSFLITKEPTKRSHQVLILKGLFLPLFLLCLLQRGFILFDTGDHVPFIAYLVNWRFDFLIFGSLTALHHIGISKSHGNLLSARPFWLPRDANDPVCTGHGQRIRYG